MNRPHGTGAGIDNAVVELDGPEPPIFDGSAAQFVFLLDCAGKVMQDATRPVIEILRPHARCERLALERHRGSPARRLAGIEQSLHLIPEYP